MKKSILFSFSLVFFSLVTPILAQTDLPVVTTKTTGDKDTFQLYQQIANTTLTGSPLENLVISPLLNLKIASYRVEHIVARISSRLAKMKQAGMLVSKADASYTAIYNKLTRLRAEIEKTQDLVVTLLQSPGKSRDYQSLRTQILTTSKVIEEIVELEKDLIIQIEKEYQ